MPINIYTPYADLHTGYIGCYLKIKFTYTVWVIIPFLCLQLRIKLGGHIDLGLSVHPYVWMIALPVSVTVSRQRSYSHCSFFSSNLISYICCDAKSTSRVIFLCWHRWLTDIVRTRIAHFLINILFNSAHFESIAPLFWVFIHILWQQIRTYHVSFLPINITFMSTNNSNV